jgi:hypothetical protein
MGLPGRRPDTAARVERLLEDPDPEGGPEEGGEAGLEVGVPEERVDSLAMTVNGHNVVHPELPGLLEFSGILVGPLVEGNGSIRPEGDSELAPGVGIEGSVHQLQVDLSPVGDAVGLDAVEKLVLRSFPTERAQFRLAVRPGVGKGLEGEGLSEEGHGVCGGTVQDPGTLWIHFGEVHLFKTDSCTPGPRDDAPSQHNSVTLSTQSPSSQFQFKMSSIKQLIINAVIKVSGENPALNREGEPSAEEARDMFIARLMAELFPEHGSETSAVVVPVVEPVVEVAPAATPAKKLTKEEKEAAKAAKAAEKEAAAKAKEEAKAAKEAEKAAKAEAKAVKAGSPKTSPEEKAVKAASPKASPEEKEAAKAAAKAAKEAEKEAAKAAKEAEKEAAAKAKEAEKEAAKAAKEAEKEAAKAAKAEAAAAKKASPKKAAEVVLPASPKPVAEVNLPKIDPTWRKVLKEADKDNAKALEPELLKFLNGLSNADFHGKTAREHVAAFIAARAPVAEPAAQVDLEVVEFNGKDYYVNPETKRVYEGVMGDDGDLKITRPIGYVGMADFKGMTLE